MTRSIPYSARLALPLLALSATSATLTAADRYWDGDDASTNMTAAFNWNLNTPLVLATDELNFPLGVALAERVVLNNYPNNTEFNSMEFYDGGYSLSGSVMELKGGIGLFNPTGTVTINCGIRLNQSQHIVVVDAGDLDFGPSSLVYLNDHVANVRASITESEIKFRGFVGGTGFLNVVGEGRVLMVGDKSYTASAKVWDGGTLVANSDMSLGGTGGKTTVADGTLEIANAAAINSPEPLVFDNPADNTAEIRASGGQHTLTGGIEVKGGGFKNIRVEGLGLAVNSAITGDPGVGTLFKVGPGRLALTGPAANTCAISSFRVGAGELFLNKSGGALAISSPNVPVGGNTGAPDSAILRLGGSEQIIDTSTVNLAQEAWFDLNGKKETLLNLHYIGPGRVTTQALGELRLKGNLQALSATGDGGQGKLTGKVVLEKTDSEWDIRGGASALDLVVEGSISSPVVDGTLRKTGTGLLKITGSLLMPTLRITAGKVELKGESPLTNAALTGGTLQVSGAVRDLNATGGDITLDTLAVSADLECRDLTLGAASTLRMTLTTAAPNAHDIIHADGAVTLNNATFDLVQVLTSVDVGQEVVFIDNDGTDPVTGQFKDMPEGTLVETEFLLSYKGGDGNDVTLTRIVPFTGVTRIWDGGGTDDEWMTPGNWNPNGVPQPGDALFFPVAANRKNNHNNFPAGTTFHSISVNGTGYSNGGNAIILNEKLEWTSLNGDNFWAMPITLAQPVTLSIAGESFVQVGSTINTNGNELTLLNKSAGDGDLYLGSISGAGSVRKTGPGQITYFEQASTYTGPTLIEEGTLAIKYQATLGSSAGGTVVSPGATLLLRNNEGEIALLETITLHGTIKDQGGSDTALLAGGLIAAADTATMDISTEKVTLAGPLSGNVLHKTGPGTLLFTSTSSNTLSGAMMLDGGTLRVQKLGGNAFACPVFIGAAKLQLAGINQLPDDKTVTITNPAGIVDLGAFTDTIDTLVMNGGTVTGTAASRLTLDTLDVKANAAPAVIAAPMVNTAGGDGELRVADGAAVSDLRFDAAVYGTGFEKTGAGRADFMTNIPLDGLDRLSVKAGSALVFANCRFTDVVLSGGLLGGNSGTVGAISAQPGGVLSPGASPGVLIGGTAVLNGAVTVRMELNGTEAATGYDQYTSGSPLTLGGAVLQLSAGFDPAPGAKFMIVRNVSGAPVSGTFANLPEGRHTSLPGGKIFRISYSGGDGDDVELTRVEAGAPDIVSLDMTPGGEKHPTENLATVTAQGLPGVSYQLESSPDLDSWTPGETRMADLDSGLVVFEKYEAKGTPRLFLRVRLP